MAGEFFIPDSIDHFKHLLNGLAYKKSIHDLESLESGSKVSNEHFTLRRAYWPMPVKPIDFDDYKQEVGLDNTWTAAASLLDDSKSFKGFLNAIGNTVQLSNITCNDDNWPAEFMPALRYLQDILANQRAERQAAAQAEALPRASREARRKVKTYRLPSGSPDNSAAASEPSSRGKRQKQSHNE